MCRPDSFLLTQLVWPLQANTDSRLPCSWCYLKGFTCFVSCGVLTRVLWYDWDDYCHHCIEKPEAGGAGSRPRFAGLGACMQGLAARPELGASVCRAGAVDQRGFPPQLVLWAVTSVLRACRFSLLSELPSRPFQVKVREKPSSFPYFGMLGMFELKGWQRVLNCTCSVASARLCDSI